MKTKLTIFFALLTGCIFAQPSNDTVIFTTLGHYYFNPFTFNSVYSPLIDRMGRPYVYGAATTVGVVVFDINNPMSPTPSYTITPAMMNNEDGSFCAQENTHLFVASGNLQSGGQRAGLSIYDVTTPTLPVLLDHWDSAAFTHGSSQVIVQGNYAYLAALDDGIIILDISNVNNIHFCSHLNMTSIACLNNNHARGLYLSNDTLLVANDCGGLRVVSVTNKYAPVEIGAYKNAAYGTGTPYYNHVFRIGDHAFIPVDYCGFEVDNVSNPAAITNEAMWNPWGCNSSNWNGGDLHLNEIISAQPTSNTLMVSGGDSQLLAFDPSNPLQPRLMGAYGPPNTDSTGAWGVDVYGNYVALGIIKTTIPFRSVYGGLQLLSWNYVLGTNENQVQTGQLNLYPNPASESCTIALPTSNDKIFTIEVTDVMGRVVKTQTADPKLNGRDAVVDLSELSAGVYSVSVKGENLFYSGRVVKK